MTEPIIELPPEVALLLDGKDLPYKQHETFQLLTIAEDGWPNVAMLSVGEVLAPSSTQLRLALWPGTNTTANIIRTGIATLMIISEGKAHYVSLSLHRLPMLEDTPHKRERFVGDLVRVKTDQSSYADITSGVRIELKEPEPVLARWQETVELLWR